jgi:phosphatidylglycerol:prolipoprotein diacylglycerol transferase
MVMQFAYWVHQPTPFLGPHWGNFGIRFYGLAYVLGFVAAGWLLVRYARRQRSQLPAQAVPDLMMAIVAGVMLGGRLGSFLFYHPQQLLDDPLSFFRVWEGGMASHGGFIGVAIALAWFARSRKISFLHLADLIASTAPVGLLLGRIANFLNGELWGTVSVVPWAVIFERTGGGNFPRHPSQLYEAALEGALMLAFMQWRFWRTQITAFRGRLCGEFLIGYAVVRMFGEQFREPDASLLFGLTRGTFYSVFLIIAGAGFVWLAQRQTKQNG